MQLCYAYSTASVAIILMPCGQQDNMMNTSPRFKTNELRQLPAMVAIVMLTKTIKGLSSMIGKLTIYVQHQAPT